jgi:hypothetical protein
LGGKSVPIVVEVTALPFTDIKVSVVKSSTTVGNTTTDNSKDITPNTNIATITVNQPSGILGFSCGSNKTALGTELKFKLDGADKLVYSLLNEKFSVAGVVAATKPDSSKVSLGLAKVDANSEAASVELTGTCPGLGGSWIQVIPGNLPATIIGTAADVKAAAAKFTANANVNQHKETQWCYKAIATDKGKTTCKFDTASGAKFNANMYCETIEGWFYPDAAMKATAYNFTAPSNGGKPVTMTLTYGKAIDPVANNDVVLALCGALAEHL